MINAVNGNALIDSTAICEYFEETVEKSPLLGGSSNERAETRRLVAWFDQKLYGEVTLPLLTERMFKRLVERAAPDAPRERKSVVEGKSVSVREGPGGRRILKKKKK